MILLTVNASWELISEFLSDQQFGQKGRMLYLHLPLIRIKIFSLAIDNRSRQVSVKASIPLGDCFFWILGLFACSLFMYRLALSTPSVIEIISSGSRTIPLWLSNLAPSALLLLGYYLTALCVQSFLSSLERKWSSRLLAEFGGFVNRPLARGSPFDGFLWPLYLMAFPLLYLGYRYFCWKFILVMLFVSVVTSLVPSLCRLLLKDDNAAQWRFLLLDSLFAWDNAVLAPVFVFSLLATLSSLFSCIAQSLPNRAELAQAVITWQESNVSRLYPSHQDSSLDNPRILAQKLRSFVDLYVSRQLRSEVVNGDEHFAPKIASDTVQGIAIGILMVLLLLAFSMALFIREVEHLPQKWKLSVPTRNPPFTTPGVAFSSSFNQRLCSIAVALRLLVTAFMNWTALVISIDILYFVIVGKPVLVQDMQSPLSITLVPYYLTSNDTYLMVSRFILLPFAIFPFAFLSSWLRFKRRRRARDCEQLLAKSLLALARRLSVKRFRLHVYHSDMPDTYTYMPIFFWKGPTIVLTTSLIGILTNEELEAVFAHELAHVQQGLGHITMLQALSCFALLPNAAFTMILDYAQLECAADQIAARAIRDPSTLASALVKASHSFAFVASSVNRGVLPANYRDIVQHFLGRSLLAYGHPVLQERLARLVPGLQSNANPQCNAEKLSRFQL